MCGLQKNVPFMNLKLSTHKLFALCKYICLNFGLSYFFIWQVVFSLNLTRLQKHIWYLDPYLCPEEVVLLGAVWYQRYHGMSPAGPEPPQGLCSQYTECLF